ncbi:MAG: EAL domain-containing protein [Gallionellaceae bacterium]
MSNQTHLQELNTQAQYRLIEKLRASEEQLQAALRKAQESEERWKFAIEGAEDGIWDWNPSSDEALYSKRWKEIIGYAEHEFPSTGAAWLEHLHPTDLERFESAVQACFIGSHDSYFIEFRMRCKDGSWKWILSRGKLISRDADGNPLRMLGTHSDISKRKAVENELQIAATAFEAQEGILITDEKNIILRVNKSLTSITGYAPEDLIGQTPNIFKSGRHNVNFFAALWASLNLNGNWEGEIWNKRKNGEIYPQYLTISAVKNSDGMITNYVSTAADITKAKQAEEKINLLAFYDSLTELPNRRLLLDRLKHALVASARNGRAGALMFIDLDNFKMLNDTFGHHVGDLLLRQVAERLDFLSRDGDTVARLGGDEFVVMLEDLSHDVLEAATQAEIIGEKILSTLNKPYKLGEMNQHSTPSIGATLFVGDKYESDELLKQADIAMYQAKNSGRNTIRFFDPKMQESVSARAAIESDLRKAIEQQEFQLYYQIQVDKLCCPTGAEALIRWNHPERGLVSPLTFIPIAEESDLIQAIGQWVLEAACAQLESWSKNSLTKDFTLSVNVSPKQFRQANFVTQVKDLIQLHAINPQLLKLELTEGLLLDNVEATISTMNTLNELGIRFSLDDFGTGYSSLQYLKRLPLDQLKIDQSFIRDLEINDSDKTIVRTIIAMAASLDLNIIAEGVEKSEQLKILMGKGCVNYQGFLFSKPIPLQQFEKALEQRFDFPLSSQYDICQQA